MTIGRPTLYDPDEHPSAVMLLARNGKTVADMAEALDIGLATFKRWMIDHPEFRAALELGREAADERVERSLFERATGYEHPAVKILTVSGGQGMGSHIETVPYTERYPPDVEAAKFWLKNRKPAKWREKSEVEQNVKHYVVELPPAVADNDPLTWAKEVRAERIRSGELKEDPPPPPGLPQSNG
jgi:transposase-like protein